MQHAKLSPSSAHRWINCTASTQFDQNQKSNKFMLEGTAAHELGEQVLNQVMEAYRAGVDESMWVRAEDFEKVTIEDEGKEIVWEVDQDMKDNVQVYVDEIMAIVTLAKDPIVGIEIKVPIDHITGEKDATGTSDAGILIVHDGELHVNDLKYGKGKKVYAQDNEQLMMYALGMLKEWEHLLADEHRDYVINSVVLHIHQPRLNHHDIHQIDIEDLLAFEFDVQQAAAKIESGKVEFNPGEKTCMWCKHKAKCDPLTDYVHQSIEVDFPILDSPAVKADTSKLAEALSKISLISSWCSAVEAAAMDELERGNAVGDWKLVAGRSSRYYTDEAKAEKMLRGKLKCKVGEIFPKKLISPAQAEKLVGKKKYVTLVEEGIVETKPGKPTLAPGKDKRPAINTADSIGFDDLTET